MRDKEVDAVVAYTLDRLSRDPVHFIILQEEMEKAGVEIILVTETIDSSDMGKLIMYIKGYAAKLEVGKIRERSIRGKRVRAQRGKLSIGRGSKMYGYSYIPGKGQLEGLRYLNESEAYWIRQWKRWLLEDNVSINAITYKMRDFRVTTPSGKEVWSRSTIHTILTNPAIMGKTYVFTYRYEDYITADGKKKRKVIRKPKEEWMEIPSATPAIITEGEFIAIQEKLTKNKLMSRRRARLSYQLSGYVFCGLCGRRYRGKAINKKGRDTASPLRYYQCPREDRVVSPTKCTNPRQNANQLEALVRKQIRSLLTNPKVVNASIKMLQGGLPGQPELLKEQLEQVEVRLKEVDNNQRKLLNKVIEEKFPQDIIIAESKKLNDQRARLIQQKAELEEKIERAIQAASNMAGVERFCELARQNIETFSDEDWKIALEALAIKLVVYPERVCIEGSIPVLDESSDSPESFLSQTSPSSVSATFA